MVLFWMPKGMFTKFENQTLLVTLLLWGVKFDKYYSHATRNQELKYPRM